MSPRASGSCSKTPSKSLSGDVRDLSAPIPVLF